MVGPGELTERVLVRWWNETGGDPWNPEGAWETRATIWAKVEIISLEERQRESTTSPFRDYRFIVRQNDNIQRTDKLVWDGLAFDIRSLGKRSGRQRYQVIEADSNGQTAAAP